jgi:hypothetical protein
MANIEKEITPTVAAMGRAGAPMTREAYLYWMSGGEITGDVELDPELEAELPVQFQRVTLLETSPATEKVQ